MAEGTREVREQVEEARQQLGDTVAALAYRVNAPRRAKERLAVRLDGAARRMGGLLGREGSSDARR
jgi:hypothetical protein